MEWVDIGLNLGHRSFEQDRVEVMERARQAGVPRALITGTNLAESEKAITLVKQFPGSRSTAGVHPHDVSACGPQTLQGLRTCLTQPEVVAVGECGLDFFRDFSPRDVQESWFLKQIDLAVELHKPLFLHERDASERFTALLEPKIDQVPGAVVHCFTGSRDALMRYLEMGCYIGITGWVCDERRGQALQALIPLIPLERLLVETDAPYLVPRDLRPKPKKGRNEPCFLPHVGAVVARLGGHSVEEVATATTQNVRTLFGF